MDVHWLSILGSIGIGAAVVVIVLLCLGGLVMSALGLSGTWVVMGGAALAALLPVARFPGWWTVLAFGVIAALAEVIEFFAGTWGVRRRSGSRLAGVAAMVGGIAGMFLGALIPVPVVGSLIGMIVLSFVFVFAVEQRRLKAPGQAAGIAWGVVIARVLVILLKVVATLAMSAWLLLDLAF